MGWNTCLYIFKGLYLAKYVDWGWFKQEPIVFVPTKFGFV